MSGRCLSLDVFGRYLSLDVSGQYLSLGGVCLSPDVSRQCLSLDVSTWCLSPDGFFFFWYTLWWLKSELKHRTYNKGCRRQEGWEREAQNSREQSHLEIFIRERDGQGTQGKQDVHYTTGTFRKGSREFEGAGYGVD